MRCRAESGMVRALAAVAGLAVLAGTIGCGPKPAAVKPGPVLPGYTTVKLAEINAAPRDFLHRKVYVEAYFAGKADHYQPGYTQFERSQYICFAAWPRGARLWLAEEMENSYPFFYVPRDSGELVVRNPEKPVARLDALTRFQPVGIYGTVVADFKNSAWIEVDTFRPLVGAAYTPESIRCLSMAAELYETKRYPLAAKEYRAALKLGVPEEVAGAVERNLGLSCLAVEEFAAAEKSLSLAREAGSADLEALLGLAEAQIETGRAAEAEKTARQALIADPRSAAARARLAVALGKRGRIQNGLAAAADGLRLNPSDVDLLRARGVLLDLDGRLGEAVEVYKQAVLAPRGTEERIQRELGQLYLTKKDFAQAKLYFENAINVASQEYDLPYCRGCCLLAQALLGLKKPTEAAQQYLLAIKRDETYIPAHMGLAALYAEGGKTDEALAEYRIVAEKLDPKGDSGFAAWRRMAELYVAKKDLAEAAGCYARAAKIKPRDYDNWMDLAQARWNQPKPDRQGALAAYARAAEVDPKAFAPHYLSGRVYEEMDNCEKAAEAFEAAKELKSDYGLTRFHLGLTYRKLCREREGLAELRAALAVFKADPPSKPEDLLDVKNSLAYALTDTGDDRDLVEAEKLALEASAGRPGEPDYADTLGWVLVRAGKLKEAEPLLEKAAKGSNSAEAFYHLGSLYHAAGRHTPAVGALNTALLRLRQTGVTYPAAVDLRRRVERLLDRAKDAKADAEENAARAARRKAEADKRAAEEARRKAEADRKAAAEAARKKAEADKKAAAEARKKAEEEAKKKKQPGTAR